MKTVRCFKCKSVMVIEPELKQAKKEVYDKLDKFVIKENGFPDVLVCNVYNELKKKDLGK